MNTDIHAINQSLYHIVPLTLVRLLLRRSVKFEPPFGPGAKMKRGHPTPEFKKKNMSKSKKLGKIQCFIPMIFQIPAKRCWGHSFTACSTVLPAESKMALVEFSINIFSPIPLGHENNNRLVSPCMDYYYIWNINTYKNKTTPKMMITSKAR